jgi:PKD repeat protein
MPAALVSFDVTSYSTAQGEIPELSGVQDLPAAYPGLDKGVLPGYGIVGDDFQSPYYAIEVPSHPDIPGGYNWQSWWEALGNAGPYDFWTDLGLESYIADTAEDPIDTLDVEVYSDNHGIAGCTIKALDQAGSVTLVATAEYPFTPKRAKYPVEKSDDIIVKWGAIELNPHFVADSTEVMPDEVITFTNLTTGGTHPYTKAQWDFNADGIPEIVRTGTEAQVMADVTYDYDAPGVYTIRLTMTDSTPTTRHEDRIDYITVGGVAARSWWCPLGGEALIAPNPGAGRPFLTVSADPADITVSAGAELWGIYYLDETSGDWYYYIPGYTSTLTALEPDLYYYVVVSAPATLTIPQ